MAANRAFPDEFYTGFTMGTRVCDAFRMGNKNTGKREIKKPAKAQPKAAPGRKREDVNQTAARIVREAPESD
jgi:hypothetical protein